MPLPTKIDAIVRKRFEDLIKESNEILQRINNENRDYHARNRDSDFVYIGEMHYSSSDIRALMEKSISLIQMVLGNTQRAVDLSTKIDKDLSLGSGTVNKCLGILSALQSDYATGILEPIHQLIEADIAADYMGQAEQLLNEGQSGKFDHVPAAVLTGAVFEDALRRLCARQIPPIPTTYTKGKPKTLNPLIDELKKAGLYSEAKAKILRGWAGTRNAAAHGEFTKFTRQDVEAMIVGVNQFLADYM